MAGIPGARILLQIRVGPLFSKMANPQQPTPLYTLPQKKSRLLIPKIITFLILGIILYAGVILNLSLLNLITETEDLIKIVALIIIPLIIVAGIIYNFIKVRQPYLFYRQYIQKGAKQLPYQEIQNFNQKQNFLDKIFKTYQIPLTKKFILQNIPQEIQISDYIQKLINYSSLSSLSS